MNEGKKARPAETPAGMLSGRDGVPPAGALRCADCGAPLSRDDIGATRKLLNPRTEQFFCVPCLAMELGVTETLLRQKIEWFRMTGCVYFQ